MKKILPILISILFMFFPVAVFAQTATLSLEPSSGTFNKGCTFSVNIKLSTGGTETDGTDAILKYDSSRFLGQSITNGTIYPDFPGNNIDNATGKITISGLASVATPFNGSGVLATVNFLVQSNAPEGASAITFDFDPLNKAETRDSNVVQRGTVADVLNSVVNGNYVVGAGSCGAGAGTGTGGNSNPRGGTGSGTATPSATLAPTPTPRTSLPEGGTQEFTMMMVIVGGALTVLGILGIALL